MGCPDMKIISVKINDVGRLNADKAFFNRVANLLKVGNPCFGISRNTNNNYIEDSRVKTLRRFFLLSFTYSLSKTGLNNAGGGGMRMIMK
jgi:hypothetical protein